MNFVDSVKSGFKNYATFSGRASRSEFWWWCLFGILARVVANILDAVLFSPAIADDAATGSMVISSDVAMQPSDPAMATEMMMAAGPTPVFGLIVGLGLLLPNIAVTARRLHDINKSGWWQLLILTLIGIIPLLIWWTKKGDEGTNRFGADPLKA